jgi:hypothetical protein
MFQVLHHGNIKKHQLGMPVDLPLTQLNSQNSDEAEE